MIRALLIFLLFSLLAAPASAHEVRPAYLEVHQTGPETFDVFWKVPGQGDKYLIANFHCYSPWSFVSGDASVIWGSPTDEDAIKKIFDGVAQFASSKGIPAMVNEFGAGPKHDTNSRTAFYQTYVDNTLSHGMAFFAWDDGGDFRTYDRQLPAGHTPGGKWVGNVKDIMTH